MLTLVFLGGRKNVLAKSARGRQDLKRDLANVASYNLKSDCKIFCGFQLQCAVTFTIKVATMLSAHSLPRQAE